LLTVVTLHLIIVGIMGGKDKFTLPCKYMI
jgi:hypothetical protein